MNNRASLHDVMAETEPFLLVGDSDSERFPGMSFACYQKVGRAFCYLDLGSRDLSVEAKGQRIFHSVEELGDWGGDLALIWVHAITAIKALELAHKAGCKRVWFSFGTGNSAAVALAAELGIQVVEVGRCPVLFLKERAGPCRVHGWFANATGLTGLPPQLDAGLSRRELV